ncbi:MAG: sigma-70 family RNA polymerase sigma factor [Opitutaceae bacterium]|nr:sigma-70 family RNA polymerase sigma factor [Opitutaceae bacterium]
MRQAWTDPRPFVRQVTMNDENRPGCAAAEPATWVDDHGNALFAYAYSRTRNRAQAEDLVQDALVAAWKGRAAFQGQSSLRSWLIGILRHKLLDHYRRASRETSFTDLGFYENEEKLTFSNPDYPGHWSAGTVVSDWPMEVKDLDRDHFWSAFHSCTEKLPPKVARIFVLREVDQIPTETLCDTFGVQPGHLWVLLHRARLALRQCLEKNWVRIQ